ncbi:hypothetical protein NBE98_07270 [Clostridium swellfunianum]|uniref:hypothetical protein n=1 Tax=Clostridium swellfunianum TaxID=1367462 RepID=UPI00202E716E|nr:hypothetical protein [Clostridium swellfunianum]MCM0648174.1 hypothetical protein [Clostridium swellfunianum]
MLHADFDNCFSILNKLACERKILWKIHYDTCIDKNGSYLLRLNYRALMPKLKYYYFKASVDYMLENTHLAEDLEVLEESFKGSKSYFDSKWLDAVSFRDELKVKDYCIASSYPVTFLREENLREKTVFRSAVIDIHKLQEKGIDLGYLLCDNRERNM